VWNSATLNGTNYTDGIRTDLNGNYQLNAFNGTWQVWLDGNELQSRGYDAPANVQTNVTGANVTVNFVVNAVPPRLSILCTNAGSVSLCWPLPPASFVLERTSQLLSPPQTTVWTPVGIAYVTNPPDVSVTVPLAPGNSFFRLRQPPD